MRTLQDAYPSIIVKVERAGGGYRAPGYSTQLRRLPSLLFEVAQAGTWQIDANDGLHLVAPAGRGFVVPSEHSHKLTYVNRIASQTRYWMISIRDILGRDLAREIARPWVLSAADTARMIECLTQDTDTHVTIASVLAHQQRLIDVGRLLFSGARSKIVVPPPVDPRVQVVMRYINEHLDQTLSRDFLADLVQLSPTRFHYVFSSTIGVAPIEYVIKSRLSTARQLLAGTSLSVKEIARLVGYRDALRFSALFRRHIGESPAIYRKRIQSGHDGN